MDSNTRRMKMCGFAVAFLATMTNAVASPSVHPAALGNSGAVAVADKDNVYIIDGATRRTEEIPLYGTQPVQAIEWSHDGQWLAWTEGIELWITSRNAQTEHMLFTLQHHYVFRWSPAADVLAFSSPEDNTLRVASTDGKVRDLVQVDRPIGDFCWSPDGKQIAFEEAGSEANVWTVYVVAISGGPPTRVYGPEEMSLLGWLPDQQGLLLSTGPQNPGLAAAGTDLSVIKFGSEKPVLFSPTSRACHHVAIAPGNRRIAAVVGEGRYQWQYGALLIFDAAGRHSQVPQPPGTVYFDPVWSDDGARLLFTRAPRSSYYGAAGPPGWEPTGLCWIAAANPGIVHPAPGTRGIYGHYYWTHDGRQVLVQRPHGLWLISVNDGHLTPLATDRGSPEWIQCFSPSP